MLVSAVHSLSQPHVNTDPPPSWACLPIPSQPSRASQGTRLSSPCYTAAPHSLSASHSVVYICQCCAPNSPSRPLTHPVPTGPSTTETIFQKRTLGKRTDTWTSWGETKPQTASLAWKRIPSEAPVQTWKKRKFLKVSSVSQAGRGARHPTYTEPKRV